MKALAVLLALALLGPVAAPAEAAKKAKCASVKKKQQPRKGCKGRLSSRAATVLLGAPGGFSTPAPFLTAAQPLPAPGAPPGDPEEPVPPPTLPPVYSNPRAVQVQAFEFGLQLSKPSVLSGDVKVEFNLSRAEDPHDLRILRDGTLYSFEELGPGAVATKTVFLGAGQWKLFCSLPGHEELGMKATLVSSG